MTKNDVTCIVNFKSVKSDMVVCKPQNLNECCIVVSEKIYIRKASGAYIYWLRMGKWSHPSITQLIKTLLKKDKKTFVNFNLF